MKRAIGYLSKRGKKRVERERGEKLEGILPKGQSNPPIFFGRPARFGTGGKI